MSALAYHRLPKGWDVRPLKRIAALNPEALPEDTDPEWTFPYVDIGNVTFGAGITGTELVRFADAPSRARRRVRNGDTIVSTVRTYLRAIAPVWNQPDDLIVSTGFAVIRARPPMDAGYLSWALRSNVFVESVVADSVGVSYPAIAPSVLGSLPVPVPPPTEQRAIADFLDRETAKIDALIAPQERLIALLDEKRQATITHAVTKGLDPNAPMKESGVEWLGKVPAQWPAVMLRFLLNYIEQGWSPEAEDRRAEPGEWAVLKSGCVNGGIFRQDEHKALPSDLLPIEELEVRPGDVIMSRASGSRALIGSVSYVEKCSAKLMLSDKLFRLRPRLNMISPRYLAIVLGAQPCRAQIEQSISGAEGLANNLTQATIKRLLIFLPSLVEQEIIMHHLDRVTAELDQLRFHGMKIIERLRERRTALITAAVTGQIDVSRPAITEAAE